METNPELEFEFYLADRLRMTVDELRAKMTNDEFIKWSVYHGRRAQKQEMATIQARRK